MPRNTLIAARFCFLLGLMALGAGPARAQTKEYQIKAAFLFNFTQFVQWPDGAFSGQAAPLCIGVLGDDPFGAALENTFRGETSHDHKLTVRRAHRLEELADCQLLFVSASEQKRVPEILAKIDSHPVVTVSEIADFAKQGGTINFYREQNKVRFEINAASAQKSGLRISSQLLRLGRIVEPPDNK